MKLATSPSTLQSLGERILTRYERFSSNPVATSVTFFAAIVIVLLMAFLSSCQSLGVPALDTFNKKIAGAYTSVTVVRDTATTLLTNHKITAAEAQSVQAQADTAREAITVARTLHTSDPVSADNKLQVALTAVTALQAYLNSKGASP